MRKTDAQVFAPGVLFSDTKANLELLSPDEGAFAYTTDTDEVGSYDGSYWHWYARMADAITYYVRKTGNDGNSGFASDDALLTIQAAVDKFAGRVLCNCVIDIGEGTYEENITLQGYAGTVADLEILGDRDKTLLGFTFVHGWTPAAAINSGYPNGGEGAITLSSDNSGDGGRMRYRVIRATTAADFGADGVDDTNKLLIWDKTAYYEYDIYAVSGSYITVDDTGTAKTVAANGCFVCVLPNVRISPASGTALTAYLSAYLKGLYLGDGSGYALYNVGADLEVNNIVTMSTDYYSAAATAGGKIRVMKTLTAAYGVAGFFCVGYYGMYVGHGSMYYGIGPACCHSQSVSGACLIAVYDSYAYVGYSAWPYTTGKGIYASQASYVFAGSTSAANYAVTPYSPSTTDTLGNSLAGITFS